MPVAPGDRAEFRALVDELAELETHRATAGVYTPDDAARLQQVERRLIQLVTTEMPQDERRRHVRLPCDLAVKLAVAGGGAGGESAAGVVVDVGAGGIFVETTLPAKAGDAVDVELPAAGHSLHVKGKVAWAATTRRTGRAGLGIAFLPAAGPADEAGERRLRRVVIELLRKRLPDG